MKSILELAIAISLISLGSIQTLDFPHCKIEAESRFWSLRELDMIMKDPLNHNLSERMTIQKPEMAFPHVLISLSGLRVDCIYEVLAARILVNFTSIFKNQDMNLSKRFLIVTFSTLFMSAILYPVDNSLNDSLSGAMLERKWLFHAEEIYEICVNILYVNFFPEILIFEAESDHSTLRNYFFYQFVDSLKSFMVSLSLVDFLTITHGTA